MKEPVHRTQHPWMVGIVIAVIAVGYFFLAGSSKFPEPGPNLKYDIQTYADLDNVDTRYEEVAPIIPDVTDPRALAVTPDGIYVAAQDAIVKFDQNDKEVARFAIDGTPNAIAVAPDGQIFVGYPTFVEVLDAEGVSLARWAPISERSYITSIAVKDDSVYVADAGKRVVFRFDRDGELLTRIGEKDPARDVPGFEVPSPYLDLAMNDEGNLWVANPGLLGLERYRDNGDIVTSWYRPNLRLEGFSGCCNPTQIAFTQSGKLITSEKGLVRVKVYEVTSGEYEELVAGSKLFPREQSLRDLAVDARDRILLLDPRSNSIRIFSLKEETDHGSTT